MTNPISALPLRAARWSATHPWRAMLGWLAFVALAVGLAIAVPTHETDDADYRLGDSGHADRLVDQAGLDAPSSESVLITAPDGGQLDATEAEDAAAALVAGLSDVEGVDEVAEPQWSPDRSALLVSAQLARDQEDVGDLQDVTASVAAEHPGLEIREAGDVSLDDAIGEQVAEDLSAAEGISLPVTLVLMLIAFGALIAAGIPVLLAATSVAATIGITAPLSHLVHAEPTVSSMIVLIGMAVGVDYSLFYLKREREERAKGASTLDAVEIAAATSGHSIVVSGLAVIASMTGLYVFGGATFNSLATGSILVVAIAVLGSITVLPALLARLGRWVDRPRVPLLWRLNRRIGKGGLSGRILGPVLRRPVAALVVSGLAVAALSLPAFGMKLQEANLDTLPDAIPEVTTFRAMADAFPSEGTTTTVVVKADAGQRVDVRAALDDLEARATASGEFEATPDAVQVSEDGRTSVLRLGLPYDESDPRVEDAVDTLRADLVPPALDGLARGVRRRGRRRRGPGLRGAAAHLAADRGRLRAAGDDADDGDRVPQHPAGAGVLRAQPGQCRRRLRAAHPGVPARFRRRAAGLQLTGLRDRLDPALRARGAGRAVDGLPRLRPEPGARARAPRAADPAGRRARDRRHRGRGHQRRGGDGLGVRDLRDPEHARDEDDGGRPVGRDPHRRHPDPAGDAARRPGAAGGPGVVAGTDLAGPR